MTFRTRLVVAIAAEQDADVHLVGFRFEPAEESLHAIPDAVIQILAGNIGPALAVHHPILIGLGQVLEGLVHIHFPQGRGAQQIALASLRLGGLERLHHPGGEGERAVRHDAVPIKADDAAEAFAIRTSAERIIEGEEPGAGRADIEVAMRAMPAGGERMLDFRFGILDCYLSGPEAKGGFDGFGEAGTVFRGDFNTILEDRHHRGQADVFRRLVGANSLAVEQDAQVALLTKEINKVHGLGFGRDGNSEGDEDLLALHFGEDVLNKGMGGFRADLAFAGWTKGVSGAGEKQFQVVVDLGDRAHGRAGGLD